MANPRVGDTGTVFRLTVRDQDGVIVDLSAATSKTLAFGRPDGTSFSRTAAFLTDGTDGIIQYTTSGSDLDQVGPWLVEGHVSLPSGSWGTTQGQFLVSSRL
jgi:hypothetical protein